MSNKPNSPMSLNDSLEIIASIAREDKPSFMLKSQVHNEMTVNLEFNNCGEFCKHLNPD